jgi:hypothetical protein
MVTDPLAGAVAAVSGSSIEQIGRFSYDLAAQSWDWSDEICRLRR